MTAQQVETATNRAEHAQGQDIHLEQPDRIEIVLVPLNDRAFGHRGVFHRHEVIQRLLGNDEAAGVLGQMPGEADQLLRQAQHPAQHRAFRVETAFTQALHGRRFITPVTTAIGQGIDLVWRQTQRLGHIAYRTGRMVSTDHGCQCRAGPTIALEHVLQDFFAAFVLEVHIDIRWLVALPGEKALKQHVHSLGVDLGDAQGETHRRVGRRASALAENLLAPGEGDDVLNGQEIAFITQLGDQPELLVDQPANLFACTVGPSLAHAALGQRPQPGLCAVPFWHQFARILITQLAKIKGTAPGDVQRFCQ
ncbi:hypothetical protein PS647_06151 [Pseudomonas fluorescens]|nr:hypothetical protein PS647_06151 [Pseudomonas fluorescens]